MLVSNAGETVRAPLESVPLPEVERLFQLNTLGALRVVQVFLQENDPYLPLYQALPALRGESVTPQDVAAAVADTIEQPDPALRVPVGLPAQRALRARKEAPESEPFRPAQLNW